MNFIQTAIQRIKSETPIFFILIRKLAAWLGGSALAILTAKNFISFAVTLPTSLVTILGYIVCICAGIAGTTFLTTADKDLIK